MKRTKYRVVTVFPDQYKIQWLQEYTDWRGVDHKLWTDMEDGKLYVGKSDAIDNAKYLERKNAFVEEVVYETKGS